MIPKLNDFLKYPISIKKQLLTALKSKKWRKLGCSFLLVIISSTLLNACIGARPLHQQEQLKGAILIWHPSKNELFQWINSNFQEFQQLNSGVNIQDEYVPQKEIVPRLIQKSSQGFGASAIIDFARNISELLAAKRIQPIEDTDLDISTYQPSVLRQVRYQGKLYGIPLGSTTRVLCYNNAKLQTSQDPILSQPPTSLDELIKRAQKGYSVGMISSFEDTFWGLGNFGSSLINDQGKIEPQMGGWAEWIKWLKKAIIQPNFTLLRGNRTVLNRAFANGNLAYYICNSSEIADLKKMLKEDLKIAILPGQGSFQAKPLLYTMAMMINRSASPNERDLVLALAKFLSNIEQQLQGTVQTQSFIPINRHVFFDKSLLPIESILLKQSETAVTLPLDNVEKLLPIFKQAEPLYQAAIAGEIPPEEAVRQLTLIINRQIAQTQEES
jgi:ABC-type glycerol-3-phosphate transport system substrate-binding protein